MKRKEFLSVIGATAFYPTQSLFSKESSIFQDEISTSETTGFFDDALGSVSKIISPVLNSFIPGAGTVLSNVGTIGNLIGSKDLSVDQILDLIDKGLDAIGGLTKDYSGDFDKLIAYHKAVQNDLNNIKVHLEEIDQNQKIILKNQFLILDEIRNNHKILFEKISDTEKHIINAVKSNPLNREYTTIDFLIDNSESTGIQNWLKTNKAKYGDALSHLLQYEFRYKKLLNLPHYVTIYLENEKINGQDVSRSMQILKRSMDKYLANTIEFYSNRNAIVSKQLKKAYWGGGEGSAKQFVNRKTINVFWINNFSTQEIIYELNRSKLAKENVDYKKATFYKYLEEAKKTLMAASQDRDSFYTTLKVVERFYWSLYS